MMSCGSTTTSHSILAVMILTAAVILPARAAGAQTIETVTLRGHPQSVHVYGDRNGAPIVVSSGDGGWIHLGPHVAELLAAKGFFVVGFDVKAYLESFTSGRATLRPEDEPGDYQTLATFASRGTARKPVLIGVSEGAGLSVLAATDPKTKTLIQGVIGVGLPNLNELGWRWKDALIYVTHGIPKEPTFSTAAVIDRVAPLPLAVIHSTQDEFVPLVEVQTLIAAAGAPKKLWIVKASDHRFSDSLPEFDRQLLEAVQWVTGGKPR
jgi:fermentation-respiration switch protein FrsA (DUF1100 family)